MSADTGKPERIDWTISRMRKICQIWEHRLEAADKGYILRRIRDKEPALFYAIAEEKSR